MILGISGSKTTVGAIPAEPLGSSSDQIGGSSGPVHFQTTRDGGRRGERRCQWAAWLRRSRRHPSFLADAPSCPSKCARQPLYDSEGSRAGFVRVSSRRPDWFL